MPGISFQALMGAACLKDLTKIILIVLPIAAQYHAPGHVDNLQAM